MLSSTFTVSKTVQNPTAVAEACSAAYKAPVCIDQSLQVSLGRLSVVAQLLGEFQEPGHQALGVHGHDGSSQMAIARMIATVAAAHATPASAHGVRRSLLSLDSSSRCCLFWSSRSVLTCSN